MDTSLIGKVLFSITGATASVGGGYYAYKHIDWSGKKNNIDVKNDDAFTGASTLTKVTETQKYVVETSAPENDGYLYMVVNPQSFTSSDKASTTQLFTTVGSNKQGNYKCKVNDIVDLTCEIKKIELDSKKQYTFPNDPSSGFKASDDLTIDEINKQEKIFLLKIKKSLLVKTSDSLSDIDILPINASTNPDETIKKFAKLKPIFVKSKTKTFGTSNYLLMKTLSAVTTSEISSNNSSAEFKCKLSLENKDIFNTDCFVSKFSDNPTSENYTEETLATNLLPASELIEKRNYLLSEKVSSLFTVEDIKQNNVDKLNLTLTNTKSTPTKTIETENIKFTYLNKVTGADWIVIVE